MIFSARKNYLNKIVELSLDYKVKKREHTHVHSHVSKISSIQSNWVTAEN